MVMPERFSRLSSALPYNTLVSVMSCGVKWLAVYTENGFEREGAVYKSPYAFTSAHASRITDEHPKKVEAGSGWVWIRVENGEHAGKTIAEVYDLHFALAT
jgi:hypothetical protein